ncbi:MAG: peroxidase [Gaiellaceae bacterium]
MHDYRAADLEPRVRALCDLAVKLTAEPGAMSRADADALRAHGWTDVAIHDAIQVISYFNYINRIAEAVGIEDEPEWASTDLERK